MSFRVQPTSAEVTNASTQPIFSAARIITTPINFVADDTADGSVLAFNSSEQSWNATGVSSIAGGVTCDANENMIITDDYSTVSGGSNNLIVGCAAGPVTVSSRESVVLGRQAASIAGNAKVAVGFQASYTGAASTGTVAVGYRAGSTSQGNHSIAIGEDAGSISQNIESIAIGYLAANNFQNSQSIAIGLESGENTQGFTSIALGYQTGRHNQGDNAIAIGSNAATTNQGTGAIAIGGGAGINNQGFDSISIGRNAGFSQVANSIILNAQGGTSLSAAAAAFYVKPVRADPGGVADNGSLQYNTSSGEIHVVSAKTFVIDHPNDSEKYLVHACLEGPEAGVYYRGESSVDGKTTVQLPAYVAKLARDFTVQVTPIFNGDLDLKLFASRVSDEGSFNVWSNGKCDFFWTVQGKRADVEVEPFKASKTVRGDGPYRYIS